MNTIKISRELIDNIIDAYNKEYSYSITYEDIKVLKLNIPFIELNGKEIAWSSVKYYK